MDYSLLNEVDELLHAMNELKVDSICEQQCQRNRNERTSQSDIDYGPLHKAVEKGDERRVRLLLKRGANCNDQKNSLEITPLHVAAITGDASIAKQLIVAGADANLCDRSLETPLFKASKRNRSEVVKLLLDIENIDVDAKNHRGWSPLHAASILGHSDTVTTLLAAGANVESKGPNMNTPLASCIFGRHVDVFNALLSAGADVNARVCQKYLSILHVAVIHQFPLDAVKKIILECKTADPMDGKQCTPLHYAVAHASDSEDVIRLLLENGACINSKNIDGSTPLHCAVFYESDTSVQKRLRTVKLLLELGADINALEYQGTSPLLLAITQSQQKIAMLLMERGADVNVKGYEGFTALHLAASNLVKDSVQLQLMSKMIEKGADTNARSDSGYTPLQFAVRMSEIKVVKLLLASGSCFDAKLERPKHRFPAEGAAFNRGSTRMARLFTVATEFFQAIRKNDLREVKKLLASGERNLIHYRSSHYKTPLHYPIWKGFTDMVLLLLQNGANPNAANDTYSSPLHYAAKFNRPEMVEALLRHGAHYDAICPETKKTPKAIAQEHQSQACLMVLIAVEHLFESIEGGSSDFIKQIDYFKEKGNNTFSVIKGARNDKGIRLIDIASQKGLEKIITRLS